MPYVFAVVCEADADRRAACELVDRVLDECPRIDWIERDVLDHYRTWCGVAAGAGHVTWNGLHHRCRELGIRLHRGGDGELRQVRLAILLFNRLEHRADAVFLIRDTECRPERETSWRTGRDAETSGPPVVLGVAHPMRESWIAAGFVPDRPHEHERLDRLRSELGFDPTTESHRLNCDVRSPREAKRVLRGLTEGDPDREHRCVSETPLPVLRERGAGCGLTDFLREVEERIVPLFTSDDRASRP